MDTAQLLLSGGNQTQQTQAITGTIPWIALAVLAGLVVLVFLKKK
ncbi:MAG TPA: hypothetical protein VNV43_00190 [Candidatus Acidoferrales bacterium]|jgi:hypothetical protein|nr:hypothetical protein [Candidatus Acidoferrales bacterium]